MQQRVFVGRFKQDKYKGCNMGYDVENVYTNKLSSGYWELRDSMTEMQVSIHDTEEDAIQSAISNGYRLS